MFEVFCALNGRALSGVEPPSDETRSAYTHHKGDVSVTVSTDCDYPEAFLVQMARYVSGRIDPSRPEESVHNLIFGVPVQPSAVASKLSLDFQERAELLFTEGRFAGKLAGTLLCSSPSPGILILKNGRRVRLTAGKELPVHRYCDLHEAESQKNGLTLPKLSLSTGVLSLRSEKECSLVFHQEKKPIVEGGALYHGDRWNWKGTKCSLSDCSLVKISYETGECAREISSCSLKGRKRSIRSYCITVLVE